MNSRILKIHQFFLAQSLYPLVLSSLLSLVIFVGRVLYGRNWYYNNLIWNLFLAWIPYLCSLAAILLYRKYPGRWLILIPPGALWLIFFPNAPYIVTDFLHLLERPPVPLWYDIGLLATFSWTGCFLAIASLRIMQVLVKRYLGTVVSWLFAVASIGLSGLGIYLGRFGRWNSWDLFTQPGEVAKDILIRIIYPFNNLRFFGFTIMFTAFLLVCYLMFVSINRVEEPDQQPDRPNIEAKTERSLHVQSEK